MNTGQTVYGQLREIRGVIRSKLHNNGIPVSIDIMKRKQEYYYNLSLSRVLSALGDDYVYSLCSIYSTDGGSRMREYICDRDLICKDGDDAYLDDQSDETIKAIREIICKCDHVGDGVAYMTNPAQYKCKKCGEMFKGFYPII